MGVMGSACLALAGGLTEPTTAGNLPTAVVASQNALVDFGARSRFGLPPFRRRPPVTVL